MPIYKLHTAVAADGLLPRDHMVITPHINATAGPVDLAGLANEWFTAWYAWWGGGTPLPRMVVKIYDVQKPKPNYPLYTESRNDNNSLTGTGPREVALCLSFFAGKNQKRRRGRLYIPFCWISQGGNPSLRPTVTHRNKLGALATVLQDLGGLGEDWSVYSKADDTARAVTNWWVDDEWDTQRRRGLRGTVRTEGTTSEETVMERSLVTGAIHRVDPASDEELELAAAEPA